MSIYAISDLHLAANDPSKAMDIFGEHWRDHDRKIEKAWREGVSEEDLVLVPGDISWAMHLKDAMADLRFIADLPGKKILLRGNHDFWWNSLTKIRSVLPEGMEVLQNNAYRFGAAVICGSRGWVTSAEESSQDYKIYMREAQRLRLSLEAGERLRQEGDKLLVMMHYPPFNDRQENSLFTELYREFGVSLVLYGHLHNLSAGYAFEGEREGVVYRHVSCDYIDFTPQLLDPYLK